MRRTYGTGKQHADHLVDGRGYSVSKHIASYYRGVLEDRDVGDSDRIRAKSRGPSRAELRGASMGDEADWGED